jgi:prostaglandin-H2 D-isomerase / glutathione transferase
MSDTRYTLHYFPGGGRAAPIRDAFNMGGIAFEDVRVPFPEFMANRAAGAYPFGAMPVLDVERDGASQRVTQTNGILRFVGKMADLYPSDPHQALRVDEVLEVLEEITTHITLTRGYPEAQKLESRGVIVERVVGRIVAGLETLAAQSGGDFLTGSQLTVADLKALHALDGMVSGFLDGFPTTLLDDSPALLAWRDRARAARDERLPS